MPVMPVWKRSLNPIDGVALRGCPGLGGLHASAPLPMHEVKPAIVEVYATMLSLPQDSSTLRTSRNVPSFSG